MGNAGSVIIFMVSLAGCSFITMLSVLYLSHHFLTVLMDSSSGIDEVHWPDGETLLDWWWKPFYTLWIVGFWTVTGAGVVGPCFVLLLTDIKTFGVFLLVFLWLIVPLGFCSTLYRRNWFAILSVEFLAKTAKHLPALLYTYAVTLPLTAVALLAVYAALQRNFAWIFAAPFLVAAALLFYARCWGRFAWLALNWDKRVYKSKRKERRSLALNVADPWSTPKEELPEFDVEELDDEPVIPASQAVSAKVEAKVEPEVEEEDEWTKNKTPYGVLTDQQAKAAWEANQRQDVPVEEGYDIGAPVEVPQEKKINLTAYYDEQMRKEEELKASTERPDPQPKLEKGLPTFRRALGRSLYQFLFYDQTRVPWLSISVAVLVWLFFLRMVIDFWPV